VVGGAQRQAARISEDATWRSNFLSFLSEGFETPLMRSYGGIDSDEVRSGGFPECVAVRNSSQLVQGGSGVLIGPNVVLTAAHVIAGGFCDRVLVGTDVENAQEVKVRTAIAHGGYGKRTTASGLEVHENDIGLLLLEQPLANCTPLKLADRAQVDMLIKCRLVGYGLNISRNGDIGMPGIQRTAVLVKAATNPDLFPCNAEYEFIAGDNITDSCAGDSGGPVLIPVDGTGSAELLVAGLVSRGLPGGGLCSGGGGIYVIPSHFQEWIEEMAASNQGTLSW
jgi:secreted trypsin-like serine protease